MGGGGGGATAPPTFSNGGPGPLNFHGSARLGDSFPKQNKFNDLRTFILINSTKWLFFYICATFMEKKRSYF